MKTKAVGKAVSTEEISMHIYGVLPEPLVLCCMFEALVLSVCVSCVCVCVCDVCVVLDVKSWC